jgi:hypothetical protein
VRLHVSVSVCVFCVFWLRSCFAFVLVFCFVFSPCVECFRVSNKRGIKVRLCSCLVFCVTCASGRLPGSARFLFLTELRGRVYA